MAVRHDTRGILSESSTEKREQIIEMLKKAYWMEIETVMSYITNSVNPDGVRAAVQDEGVGQSIAFARPPPGARRLGLQFVEQLADTWGVEDDASRVWVDRCGLAGRCGPPVRTEVVQRPG